METAARDGVHVQPPLAARLADEFRRPISVASGDISAPPDSGPELAGGPVSFYRLSSIFLSALSSFEMEARVTCTLLQPGSFWEPRRLGFAWPIAPRR